MMRKVLGILAWSTSIHHRNTWLAWSMRCFRGTWFT